MTPRERIIGLMEQGSALLREQGRPTHGVLKTGPRTQRQWDILSLCYGYKHIKNNRKNRKRVIMLYRAEKGVKTMRLSSLRPHGPEFSYVLGMHVTQKMAFHMIESCNKRHNLIKRNSPLNIMGWMNQIAGAVLPGRSHHETGIAFDIKMGDMGTKGDEIIQHITITEIN